MSANEAPLIVSAFILSGENFDPHACAALFALKPTTVTVRGEPRAGKRPIAPTTSWCFEVRRRAQSIDEVLREVLDIVWPRRDIIKGFAETAFLKVTLTSHVKIFSERPLYCLSPATLERMAYFKAEFCLDIFDISE